MIYPLTCSCPHYCVLYFLCLHPSSHCSHQTFPLCPLELTSLLINSPASSVHRILSSPPYSNRNLAGSSSRNTDSKSSKDYLFSKFRCQWSNSHHCHFQLHTLLLILMQNKNKNKNHFSLEAFAIQFHVTLNLCLRLLCTNFLLYILPALWLNFTPLPQIQPIIPSDFTACGYTWNRVTAIRGEGSWGNSAS